MNVSRRKAPGNGTAAVIREQKSKILSIWRDRLQQEIAPARQRTVRELTDHIPVLLDQLCVLLENEGSTEQKSLEKQTEVSKRHGEHRVAHDFELDEALLEYKLLRQTVFEVIEESIGTIIPTERDSILDFLQTATKNSATEFVKVQDYKQSLRWITDVPHLRIKRILISVAAVGIATIVQATFWPFFHSAPYLLFYPAIIFAAIYGAPWVAILLSVIGTQSMFYQRLVLIPENTEDWIRTGIFLVAGSGLALLGERLRKVNAKAMSAANRSKMLAERQDAIAQFANIALKSDSLEVISEFAVTKIASILKVPHTKILQLTTAGTEFRVLAAVGCDVKLDKTNAFPISAHDQAGFTIVERGPVIVRDFSKETRFARPSILANYNICSGISVLIEGENVPFGVLTAHAIEVRDFNEDDKNFLTAIADTLASAIERGVAQKEVNRIKDEAVKAAQAKSQFLSNMSHEIRTPMNAILGFTTVLLEEKSSEKEKFEFLTRIKSNGDQLLKLIDDILDLSKFEAGKLPVENMKFSVTEVVSDVAASLASIAKQQGNRIDIVLDTAIPQVICSDPYRLRQALNNLIGNSLKFTKDGEVELRLRFINHPRGSGSRIGCLVFEVKDNGIGMTLENQKNLFEPFMQANGSVSRKFGGTGLGLYLSKKIANALGGDIELVQSAPGKGSCFRLMIETGAVSETLFVRNLTSVPPEENLKSITFKSTREQQLQGIKILAAEDSPDNIMLVRLFLEPEGAELSFATDGLEAIEAAESEEFDLVLMDVQMPNLDGLEATKRLRSNGYKKPIIALTAHALREEVDRSLSAGCNAHLSKPISRESLVETVKRFCKSERQTPLEITH